MRKQLIFIFLVISTIIPGIKAQNFFDTSDASTFFSFGARIGFNTSNRTFPSGHYNSWNNNGWGTGFNVGGVVDINFKEYLSLQPGIFFDYRTGTFSYLTDYVDFLGTSREHYEMGSLKGYNLLIPVVGSVKFNVSNDIKWKVDFGPYLQISLKQTGQNNVAVLYRLPQSQYYEQFTAKLKKYDVGLKMGTGLQLFQHYYLGVHYLAGLCHAWSVPAGGLNKEWTFTVGYDF